MLKKYSKSSDDILHLKQSFFTNNDGLLSNIADTNQIYVAESERITCKNCGAPLGKVDFISFGVPYIVCGACSHINGAHENTAAFSNLLYKEDDGHNYGADYLDYYDDRVASIYAPKLRFLLDVLRTGAAESPPVSVTDIGCGAGHFIKACELMEIEAIGFDPNRRLVALGNSKLSVNSLVCVEMDESFDVIAASESKVISMLGVLEHLNDPGRALAAFVRSKSEYLFLSLPMFSLSVFLENCFPFVFPRQLAGGHTHLYTKKSIQHLIAANGLRSMGEWWFGTDFSDLFRSISITLRKNGCSDEMLQLFDEHLGRHIDKLQSTLDEREICSEVHLVLGK